MFGQIRKDLEKVGLVMLLMDEIEAWFDSPDNKENHTARFMAELQHQIEGSFSNNGLLIVMTTNK